MSSSGNPEKRRRIDWVYATLPVSIGLGPIGTFVQLYLLNLDGIELGTIYVAAAATAFNAVSIPAAVLWGRVTDRLQKRKAIIVLSYLLTALFLFSFVFTDTNASIILVYSLVSFISSASATPLDLLIMETQPKNGWAAGFARLSFVSSVGAMLGYVIGSVWARFLPVQLLVVPLGILSVVSAIMSVLLLPEPAFTFEREMVVLRKPLFQRITALPSIFLDFPRLYDFRAAFRGLRSDLTSYAPLLYVSIILFYLGSGLFNTSFVPSLTSHALSGSDVYTIIVVASALQIVAFRLAAKYLTKQDSLAPMAARSLVIRGGCYALLGIALVLFRGTLIFAPSLVLYPIAAGIAYAIYYTASNTMIFNAVAGRNVGSSLGVYSAVVGISTTVGSLASGFTAHYLGFEITFLLAGGVLGVAALITSRLPRYRAHDAKG